MGKPIAVRTNFAAFEMRRLAARAKDSDQGPAASGDRCGARWRIAG